MAVADVAVAIFDFSMVIFDFNVAHSVQLRQAILQQPWHSATVVALCNKTAIRSVVSEQRVRNRCGGTYLALGQSDPLRSVGHVK